MGRNSRRSKLRQELLEKNPFCSFCNSPITEDNSGLFQKTILSCVNCIYEKRDLKESKGKRTAKRKKILAKDNKCYYCKKELTIHTATLDHKKPKSKKGRNAQSNLVICCYSCNHKKKDTSDVNFKL